MRVIARSKIIEYYTEHPDAETALEDWYQKVKKAEWTCFADMKQMFNSVDNVGNQHYVFNIRGNNYRLIVVIKFTIKTVLIRFIGTCWIKQTILWRWHWGNCFVWSSCSV